jgi:hypothetical protein
MASRGGLGNLAAGFLQAFSQTKMHRERQDERDEERKLRTKLYELQFKKEQQRSDAQGKVEGMMAPRPGVPGAAPVPKFSVGGGGLGFEQSGVSRAGMGPAPGRSLPEMLSDPEGLVALMQSGSMPQVQQAHQIQSRSKLADLVGNSGMSVQDAFQQPEVASAALGSGLSPAAFMAQSRGAAEEPSVIRELRAVGIDPTSAEGRKLVVGRMEGSGLDAQLQVIQAGLQSLQLDEARRKREQEGQDRARGRRQLETSITHTLSKGQELATLNHALSNTALATGQPLVELYRAAMAGGAPVLERMGVDTTEAQTIVGDFDRFNKLATDFGIDMMDRMAGTGTITEAKFQALQKAMAGIGTSPAANALVISDVLQTALDGADIENVEVPGRAGIETIIKTLKGSTGPDFATMTDDQLRALASGQ